MNKIIYKGREYSGRNLDSVEEFIGDALVSDFLTVDTMTATVRDDLERKGLVCAEGVLVYSGALLQAKGAAERLDKEGRYGEPILQYRGADIFGKFYLDNVKRVGKDLYELNAVSAVGLLVKDKHYGGIYNGEPAGEIIANIIGKRVAYTLEPALADIAVYGHLPIASCRDNLRDVLFAIGGQIRKDSVGELNIIPMQDKEAYEISAREIYHGGAVTGTAPVSEVQVTEHRYAQLATDEETILFEGEAAGGVLITPHGLSATGVLIEFDEPCYDLKIKNAAIIESGVNYAVISTSPAAVLTGRKYAHITRIISLHNDTGGERNVLTSKKCGLVSLVNSELVAERLMAYYGSGQRVETEFVATKQKPGDMVRLLGAFGDEIEGFITDMEISASNKMKAKATVVAGFVPAAYGNYYSHVDVITADGLYTVPAECKGKIRVVLIGGGNGGAAGSSGAYGAQGNSNTAGKGGAGGEGGAGGAAGKIYVATLTAAIGQQFNVQIGKGGAGAAYGAEPSAGTETTFADFSTADGYSPDSGYSALLTDIVYASDGPKGIDGGKGLDGMATEPITVEYNGKIWTSGQTGSFARGESAAAGGGGGGGPAVGANGGNGTDGEVWIDVNGVQQATGGDGGAGATPIPAPDATIPGSGGSGGHGGAGGGGGGGKSGPNSDVFAGNGGAGGQGGNGGSGADGIILVYY